MRIRLFHHEGMSWEFQWHSSRNELATKGVWLWVKPGLIFFGSEYSKKRPGHPIFWLHTRRYCKYLGFRPGYKRPALIIFGHRLIGEKLSEVVA